MTILCTGRAQDSTAHITPAASTVCYDDWQSGKFRRLQLVVIGTWPVDCQGAMRFARDHRLRVPQVSKIGIDSVVARFQSFASKNCPVSELQGKMKSSGVRRIVRSTMIARRRLDGSTISDMSDAFHNYPCNPDP